MTSSFRLFVGRPETRWAVIGGTTIVGAIGLVILGPIPVLQGSTRLSENVPYWYMLAAFPVLGMLIADLVKLLATERRGSRSAALVFQLTVLILVSVFRLSLRLPISGHTLLYSAYFTGEARKLKAAQTMAPLENLLATILFLATSFVKLYVWQDLLTWVVGVLAGIALVLSSNWIVQSIGRSTD